MKSSGGTRLSIDDPVYASLKRFIIDATGLDYFRDKDRDLVERLEKRMNHLGIKDFGQYFQLLNNPAGQKEMDALVAELTIGETYFFRHNEQFDALRDFVIPGILERNQAQRQLRVWSAGCASGAEPYSLSIFLKTQFAHLLADWDVSILGTDINKDFLARAEKGIFEEWAFRTTTPDQKRNCFSPSGKSWMIKPEFRKGVSFKFHNLVTEPFPSVMLSNFDLIFCRNVAIYFSQSVFQKIILQFEQSLNMGGWLMVGHSEPNMEMFRSFRTVSLPGAIVYQRVAEGYTEEARLSAASWPSPVLNLFPNLPPVPSLEFPDWAATAPLSTELPKLPGVESAAEKPINGNGGVGVPPTSTGGTPVPHTVVPDLDAVRTLADLGQWEKACAGAEALLRQDHLSSPLQFCYALILEHMGREAESEQALRRAVYLDRRAVLAHYYLGLRLVKKEVHREAARSFENTLRLLAGQGDDSLVRDGDGITASELRALAQTHLEAMNRHA